MLRVLVTGSEYPAGLAALRALHQAGFEAWAAVQSRTSLGARSRAAAGRVDVPDPRTAPNEFAGALAAAVKRLDAAAVLPGTEAALLALAGREHMFPTKVAVGTAPETALRRATDKTALALLSLRAGLDVPPTRVVDFEEAMATGEYVLSGHGQTASLGALDAGPAAALRGQAGGLSRRAGSGSERLAGYGRRARSKPTSRAASSA